ncbi:nucleotide-binding alpha-beta plait domain-containing protein [Tanacetum coccineum]
MGSKRTKEDDVLKISTSVFVTNFPEQASAKDLWNACKQYGHVVDAFIPNKRSKAGKRFGFVRFIKVFDVERLVGNLCTVWIGRHRIHANAARFHRPKGSTSSHQPAMKGKIRDSSIGNTKDNGHRDDVSSYANVVKNQSQGNGENDSKPVLVLDDSCVNTQDYSCCLNGKVKEVGVLENLKVALGNEGFTDIDLRYMGGLWVMIAFDSVEAKEKFLLSTGVCSWFSQLIQASSEFRADEMNSTPRPSRRAARAFKYHNVLEIALVVIIDRQLYFEYTIASRSTDVMVQLERLGYVLLQEINVGLILNGLTSDFAGFVRNYNMHNMGKTIGELHALLIEYEKGLPKNAAIPQVLAIQGGRIQKPNKEPQTAKGMVKEKASERIN